MNSSLYQSYDTDLNNQAVVSTNIIKIEVNENQEPVLSARELHDFLGATERFTNWFDRQLQYDFEENIDYVGCKVFNTQARQELQDYILKLDMAKEIAMIQRSEKGKQARRYFLQIEKDWNSPEKVMARALILANKKIDQLQIENQELKPKAIFADAVSASQTSILVGESAKILKQNGINTGGTRLFNWLRENGYLIKRRGTDYNMPTQKSMDLGLFEIKETNVVHSDGHVSISKTPKVTGKGQVYFVNKFKSAKQLVN